MAVLITGATGYVGRKLCSYLRAKGDHVGALVRDPDKASTLGCEVFVYDGSQGSIDRAVSKLRPDCVFHVATHYGSDDVDALLAANIRLGVQLLEAMVGFECSRLINVGTYWQHALGTRDYCPNGLYAASKQAMMDFIDCYVAEHGISALTLKLYDVYGADDHRPKLLPALINAAKTGEAIDLTPGDQQICPVYIDDVLDGFWAAYRMAPQAGHQEYFLSAETVTLKQIVKEIEHVAGKKVTANWGARPYPKGQIMAPYIGPPLPGFEPKVKLPEGLTKLIEAEE